MSEPEFPLCSPDDPRVPVVVNMLRKSMLMGGNFTLDARRILAALDRQEEAAGVADRTQEEAPPLASMVGAAPGLTGGLGPTEYLRRQWSGEPADAFAPSKHIGGPANAEDCPACSGTNPPYPWICPGEPDSPASGRTDEPRVPDRIDYDKDGELDDVVINNCMAHLERLDTGCWHLGLYGNDGRTLTIDIASKTGRAEVTAFVTYSEGIKETR